MFRNILISLILAVVSTVSASAVAASSDSVSTLSAVNDVGNEVVLLNMPDTRLDQAKNRASQTQSLSVVDSESVLSTEWLFIVALFWFVMLSNRRSV